MAFDSSLFDGLTHGQLPRVFYALCSATHVRGGFGNTTGTGANDKENGAGAGGGSLLFGAPDQSGDALVYGDSAGLDPLDLRDEEERDRDGKRSLLAITLPLDDRAPVGQMPEPTITSIRI